MIDNWYRITYPTGNVIVEYIEKNSCRAGTVTYLRSQCCLIEEVVVLSKNDYRICDRATNQIAA
jgi:hypothetical protein